MNKKFLSILLLSSSLSLSAADGQNGGARDFNELLWSYGEWAGNGLLSGAKTAYNYLAEDIKFETALTNPTPVVDEAAQAAAAAETARLAELARCLEMEKALPAIQEEIRTRTALAAKEVADIYASRVATAKTTGVVTGGVIAGGYVANKLAHKSGKFVINSTDNVNLKRVKNVAPKVITAAGSAIGGAASYALDTKIQSGLSTAGSFMGNGAIAFASHLPSKEAVMSYATPKVGLATGALALGAGLTYQFGPKAIGLLPSKETVSSYIPSRPTWSGTKESAQAVVSSVSTNVSLGITKSVNGVKAHPVKSGLVATSVVGAGLYKFGPDLGVVAKVTSYLPGMPTWSGTKELTSSVVSSVVAKGGVAFTGMNEHRYITGSVIAAGLIGTGVYKLYNRPKTNASNVIQNPVAPTNPVTLEIDSSAVLAAELMDKAAKAAALDQAAGISLTTSVNDQIAPVANVQPVAVAETPVVEEIRLVVIEAPVHVAPVVTVAAVVAKAAAPQVAPKPAKAIAPQVVAAVVAKKATPAVDVDLIDLAAVVRLVKQHSLSMTPGAGFFKADVVNVSDETTMPKVRGIASIHQYASFVPEDVIDLADTIVSYAAFMNYITKRNDANFVAMTDSHKQNINIALTQKQDEFDALVKKLNS